MLRCIRFLLAAMASILMRVKCLTLFLLMGKGQLGQAKDVFNSLDVDWDKNRPLLIGAAKGVTVKQG